MFGENNNGLFPMIKKTTIRPVSAITIDVSAKEPSDRGAMLLCNISFYGSFFIAVGSDTCKVFCTDILNELVNITVSDGYIVSIQNKQNVSLTITYTRMF